MAWETSERNILDRIVKWVNPTPKPGPDGSLCPTYHPGNGWWQWDDHRKLAYNDFNRVSINDLEEMFNDVKARIHPDHIIADQPFGDILGVEDEFAWRRVKVSDTEVLISVRKRDDNWYDFCLTVFTNHKASIGPDIS